MNLDTTTTRRYNRAINQLDPNGPPKAQLIYGNAPPKLAKIAILDASYNPMTLAHEALFHTAKTACNLDTVLLMLSSKNVDKGLLGADLGQRLAMLVYYAQQHPQVSVAICSHARFIDKRKALTPCYPPHTQFYFIVGYDTLIRLFDSKYYTDMSSDLQVLFKTCQFIAANRGTNDAKTLTAFLQQKAVVPFADKIHAISLPESMANISSTDVRENIKHKKTIEQHVPKAIQEAIVALKLYQKPT